MQAQFASLLTDRRQTLIHNLNLRHEADYGRTTVTQLEASRALRSRQFIDTGVGKDVSGS